MDPYITPEYKSSWHLKSHDPPSLRVRETLKGVRAQKLLTEISSPCANHYAALLWAAKLIFFHLLSLYSYLIAPNNNLSHEGSVLSPLL